MLCGQHHVSHPRCNQRVLAPGCSLCYPVPHCVTFTVSCCAVLCCVGCRRLEYRPHNISWADVEAEAKTGKTFVSPYPDREGRPVVIMRPRWVGGVKVFLTHGRCTMLASECDIAPDGTHISPHFACTAKRCVQILTSRHRPRWMLRYHKQLHRPHMACSHT
jgi:hypothetical protein